MLVTLCFCIFSNSIERNRIFGALPILAFFGVMVLTVVVSDDIGAWYKAVESYLKIMIFYYVLASTVKNEREFTAIIFAYIAIMFIYEAKSLFEYFVNGRHVFRMGIRRLVGIDESGGDPNTFASSIVYSLPFAYALYQMFKGNFESRWKVRFLYTYGILSVVCIILTGSRTGFASLTLFGFLIWTCSRSKMKTLIIMCIISSVTWHFIPQEKKIRISSIIDSEAMLEGAEGEKFKESAKISAESRGKGFWEGYELMKSSPILGYGVGSFKMARGKVGGEVGLQPHNLYGQLMGEMGMLGIVAFGALLLSMITYNLRIIRQRGDMAPFANACLMSITLLLVNGYASHNLYRFNWLWIAAFTSILAQIHNNFSSRQVVS